MACFATHSKISTQLGLRAAPGFSKCRKAFFFGHYINFIPWYKSHFNWIMQWAAVGARQLKAKGAYKHT